MFVARIQMSNLTNLSSMIILKQGLLYGLEGWLMHGITPVLIAPILPVFLGGILAWLKELRDRRDLDKKRQRGLTETREAISIMREWTTVYDLVSSSDKMSEETKLKAMGYLDREFSQFEEFLVPRAAQERITLRRLAATTTTTILLKEQLKTHAGKAFLVFYYLSLFWALILIVMATYIALSQVTFVNIMAVIILILILGILPAWSCRVLTISVDKRHDKKLTSSASDSKLQDLGGLLAGPGSANADPVATREVPWDFSPAQPAPATTGSPTSATPGTAALPLGHWPRLDELPGSATNPAAATARARTAPTALTPVTPAPTATPGQGAPSDTTRAWEA